MTRTILLTKDTRFESTGKKFAIFRDFSIDNSPTQSNYWWLGHYVEQENNIICGENPQFFPTLQKAFDHAHKLNLSFF